MWTEIAMGSLNVAAGYGMRKAENIVANSNYKLESERATSKWLANASSNMLSMVDAKMKSYNIKRQNSATLKAYGEEVSKEGYNASKWYDKLNNASFTTKQEAMGNIGAIAADAAYAGVGGSSVESAKGMEEARQIRQDKAIADQGKDYAYTRTVNQVALMDNAYNNLQDPTVFAQLNFQAKDLVVNKSKGKYSISDAIKDFSSGYSGNLDKVGINMSDSDVSSVKGFFNDQSTVKDSLKTVSSYFGYNRL